MGSLKHEGMRIFLKTLPALRAAMQKGEVVIDGIEPPQAQPPVEMQHSPQWDATQHRTTNEPIAYMPQVCISSILII